MLLFIVHRIRGLLARFRLPATSPKHDRSRPEPDSGHAMPYAILSMQRIIYPKTPFAYIYTNMDIFAFMYMYISPTPRPLSPFP